MAAETVIVLFTDLVGSTELLSRVGVAVGDAKREDGDYFGLPVVEAARLCAKAEGGEILTTEFVRMLAKSRSDAPVEISEARPPLPARLASSMSSNFVGRSEEHEQLLAAWKAVTAQGERRVMLLSGEPGIGKTILSARFACEVYDEGATVMDLACRQSSLHRV